MTGVGTATPAGKFVSAYGGDIDGELRKPPVGNRGWIKQVDLGPFPELPLDFRDLQPGRVIAGGPFDGDGRIRFDQLGRGGCAPGPNLFLNRPHAKSALGRPFARRR